MAIEYFIIFLLLALLGVVGSGIFTIIYWKQQQKGQGKILPQEEFVWPPTLEGQKKKRSRKFILIIFFPITIYVFIGTTLFFVLYQIDRVSKVLADYAKFYDAFTPREYHKEDVWLTVLFPLIFPFLAVWVLLWLLVMTIAAICRFIYDVLVFIWETAWNVVVGIWNALIGVIKDIWEEVKSAF